MVTGWAILAFVSITGLTVGTKYYVRAYATNSLGTAYSQELSFITKDGVVSLTTTPITDIEVYTATAGGDITDDGGAPVTTRGVCWGTSPDPTISNGPHVPSGSGTGQFSVSITGLAPATKYYVRAYATNSVGTTYGNQQEFTTKTLGVDDAEGNHYATVIIGNQEWMAENLKATKYNDGTPIPNVTDKNEWANLTTDAYCWYDNDPTNGNTYGALYTWYAVNTGKLCPTGWHVPTDDEWDQLVAYAGGKDIAANKLKATNGWLDNGNGTDDYGFSALPGGFRYYGTGTFDNMGIKGLWWSSTEYEYDASFAWYRYMYHLYESVKREELRKSYGFSVRCVRD